MFAVAAGRMCARYTADSAAGGNSAAGPSQPDAPREGMLVAEGSLGEPYASFSLDLLLPVEADVASTLARARGEAEAAGVMLVSKLADDPAKPIVTVELVSFSDLGWPGKKPGYVEAWTGGRDLQACSPRLASSACKYVDHAAADSIR